MLLIQILHVSHLPFLRPTLYLIQKIAVSAIFTVIKTASASESESGHGAQKTSSHSGSGTGDINSKPTSSASVLHAGVQTSLLVALGSALGGALLGVMMIL